MPSDKLTFLEQLSNALAGQSATSGAKALGEGIGYGFSGGALSDIPDVMREAIESHREKSAIPQSKPKQDALELASALAAMSNPVSLAGHAVDFAGAVPSMIQQKLSGEPLPTGQVMESGLKRRLAKGGAQAEFAMANQLDRAKQNIVKRDIDYPLQQGSIEKFVPIQSTRGKWGPGEGKFQVIDDYNTRAYDLTKKSDRDVFMAPERNVIEGNPHELGIEFHTTHGLTPEYRGKGYGKAIYQNMADVYGGGISDKAGTSELARPVYKSLGAIDTGIPSYGGTRQALPTTAMKNDPEAMAAFEAKVKEYAKRSPQTSLESAIDNLGSRDRQYLDRELESLADRSNGYVHESEISDLLSELYSIDLTGRNIPAKLELDSGTWVREPNRAFYKRLP